VSIPVPDLDSLEAVLQAAILEDVGSGDVTTQATVPESAIATARYTSKQALVVAGLPVVARILRMVDPGLRYEIHKAEGEVVSAGTGLAEVSGSARSILTAERVTLNMLQRLCGIATLTREYVKRVEGTRSRVADTRKTVPGLRVLDKYAVACGGGVNHRIGLFDAILIKNNHLAFHASIAETVREARSSAGEKISIEVEVRRPEDVDEAISAGADMVLLDNFTPEQTREAVRRCGGRVPLESSGGITLLNIREYAEAGVDRISVGALTHSAPAADIHLRIMPG